MLIDVALPAQRNIIKKNRKEFEYKSLCIEIERMWNTKCMIIPVITGDTGIVTNV